MDRNSNTYLKIKELEKDGYRELLINESRMATELQSEPGTSGMGNGLSRVTGIITQGATFLQGKIWEQTEPETEYEFPDEQATQESQTERHKDPLAGIPDDSDPILYTQTEECQEKCERILGVLSPKGPPTFNLVIPPGMTACFTDMIDWISQTSRARYSAEFDGKQMKVTYLGPQASIAESRPVSPGSDITNTNKTDNTAATESIQYGSESTTRSSAIGQHENTANLSSSAQSIIAQLSVGVYLLPKNPKDKKKLITLSSLKTNEHKLASILSANPRVTLPELLKTILKKSNQWTLINKFYKVSDYVVKN